jgi:hypothetical protein
MIYRNIYLAGNQGACSQWPNQIGAVVNADWPTAQAEGWRKCPPEPPLAEGYSRQHITLVEGDGEYGQWQVVDRSIAEMEAEEDAAVKAANIERWILDNAFLMVCQSYFGTPEKRGTAELLKKAFEIVAVDQVAGMKAFAVVIGLDKELVRVSGDRWWDDCGWHDDADAIAGAQALLQEMGG